MPRTARIGIAARIAALTPALAVPASAVCQEPAGAVEKLTPVDGFTGVAGARDHLPGAGFRP